MSDYDLEAFLRREHTCDAVQDADTDDEAEGFAADALAEAGHEYDPRQLITVVRKIREG